MQYQNEIEFAALQAHFRELSPKGRVIEIGSLLGDTLRAWMILMDKPGILLSIDAITPRTHPQHRIQKDGHQIHWPREARANGLEFFCFDDDSTNPITVANAKSILPEADFLFIDGGHDFRTVKSDWENYGPLVRPGGIVAFHDLGRQYPDVRKLWDGIKIRYRNLEIVQRPEQWGIGVLWK